MERRAHQLYTALLAHDISNFNQTSRGYIELLLDEQMGQLSDEQLRVLSTCLRQCHRIQSVIDAVRLLERLEQEPPRLEPTDLDQMLREAIEGTQTALSDQDIRVRFTPAGRKVLGEPHLLEVLRQLLGNAARHNAAEMIEIDLQLRRLEGPPPQWELMISDNGNGVPPARRELIFNRLRDGEVHGVGLGLSLARVVVERCGGRLWLEDTPEGQGATFGLSLPLLA